jgi:hypothetical protein
VGKVGGGRLPRHIALAKCNFHLRLVGVKYISAKIGFYREKIATFARNLTLVF